MAKAFALYNPIAGDGKKDETIAKLKEKVSDELILLDITIEESYNTLFSEIGQEDYIIVCGGDGTINHFVNKVIDLNIENDIRYFPCGSGNDFAREFGKEKYDTPFSIKQYLTALPSVEIAGKSSYFINGIGYGIDGYCCDVGNQQRATSDKPINYTNIAIKGLLFYYKPSNAKITVDGKEYSFKKVWIAPTMNGKYYGGGFMPTPDQDRASKDKKLSVMVFHGTSALKTLILLPSLFTGEHVKYEKHVTIFEGYDISVEFDSPRAAQIDGESFVGITSYRARSSKLVKTEA